MVERERLRLETRIRQEFGTEVNTENFFKPDETLEGFLRGGTGRTFREKKFGT